MRYWALTPAIPAAAGCRRVLPIKVEFLLNFSTAAAAVLWCDVVAG